MASFGYSGALAGENATALVAAGIPPQCSAHAAGVSSLEGNFGSRNQYG
jgi:hypothetical protein